MPAPCVNENDRRWAKSSLSGAQNDCVEATLGLEEIRDTKHREVTLKFSPHTASAFREALGRGDLVNA